jgi:hypothetical protein
MFDVGDFIFSYDLISAYHHIEIFEEHQQYLGFVWFFEGKIRYFVFAVLPFGISIAGYIFQRFWEKLSKISGLKANESLCMILLLKAVERWMTNCKILFFWLLTTNVTGRLVRNNIGLVIPGIRKMVLFLSKKREFRNSKNA